MSFLNEPVSIIPLRPVRKIGNINVNVVIQENTNDTLTITRQPVQQGASITDHSYKEPTTLSMSIYLQNNSFTSLLNANTIRNPLDSLSNSVNGLAKIYKDLLDLQNARSPIDVITPKRIYRSMLISTLSNTTDRLTENCLKIDIGFQEVIIVKVSTTQVPRIRQKFPGATGKTENAGRKQSALSSITQGFSGLLGGSQ